VANAPCDANGTIVNPGDPAAMPQPAKATPASGNRDAASGLPTGKRQHKPISVD